MNDIGPLTSAIRKCYVQVFVKAETSRSNKNNYSKMSLLRKKLFNHINMHCADHYSNVRINHCGKFKVSSKCY